MNNKKIIVANWKMNPSSQEEALRLIKNILAQRLPNNIKLIIAPPFVYLDAVRKILPREIKLGGQNISFAEQGAYTGEISALMLKNFGCEYVIIGHSEERKLLNESDSLLQEKVSLSLKYGLTPIFCVQDKDTFIPQGVSIVAYEPIFAIGSGNPDTPQNASQVAKDIKEKGNYKVLYGGSVTSANIKTFTMESDLSGVLVGGGSLEAAEFIKIIQNA